MTETTVAAEPRILVIEDDPATRMPVQQALANDGYTVLAAADGHEGLALFHAHNPAIVLLDVVMPDMDGFATCRAIRETADFNETAVLMMTGLDDVESIEDAFTAGATDFITKPINWSLLNQRVRYALRLLAMQRAIRHNEVQLAQAQRLAKVAYWEYDAATGEFHWSPGMRDLLDLHETRSPHWLSGLIHPDDADQVAAALNAAFDERAPYAVEHRVRDATGSERVLLVRGEPIGDSGDMVGAVQDISAIRRTEARLSYLTRYDPVTGLANRDTLMERVDAALAEANSRAHSVAVLVLESERCRHLRENVGAEAADQFLGDVAERVRARLDAGMLAARAGGDDIGILVPRVDRGEDAARVAQRVRDAFQEPFRVADQDVYSRASIGIAMYPADATAPAALLNNANVAMRKNRDQDAVAAYSFYTSDMNARVMQQIALETDLRRALEREQFVLYFQPQIDARSGDTVGFEALLRWHHPAFGVISPATFIPILEETDLIIPAGHWLFREAARQCAAWRRQTGLAVRVAINLSARQFHDPELLPAIRGAVMDHDLPPAGLELEITESIAMADPESSLATLHALKDMGFGLAIDDFGTGYSSLSYLKQLPLDKLKIDRTFVQHMDTRGDDATIVRSTIHLAHDLGMTVVAEGVESAEHTAMLRDMGCECLQGFYFGRPAPAHTAVAVLPDAHGAVAPRRS